MLPRRFTRVLPAAEACGARLAHFSGEGWIACGDAAMCFDPISGQGIFSALHSGSEAAQAVHAALDGERALLGAYARRMDEVWSIYRGRREALYASEAALAGPAVLVAPATAARGLTRARAIRIRTNRARSKYNLFDLEKF